MSEMASQAAGAAGQSDDGDESIWTMMAGAFRGKLAWVAVVVWAYGLIFTALLVIAAVMFFRVGQTREQILWATVFLASFIAATSVKLFSWMLMFRGAALRRLKRLESRLG